MKRIFLIIFLFLLIFSSLSNASSIKKITITQKIITVDNEEGDADYTSIQDAIDNADPEDIIEVYSGTYYEIITINKQIILRGIDYEIGTGNDIGDPIIDNDYTSTGSIIKVMADDVEITGFIIEDFHKWRDSTGITITSKNNTIMHNVIRKTMGSHGGSAIWLKQSSENEVSYNEIYTMKDGWTSIYKGIEIDGGRENLVHHNILNYVSFGVDLYGTHNKVFRNKFFKSELRIGNQHNLAAENYFDKGRIELISDYCKYNTIYRNNFNNAEEATYVYDAVNNDIIENNYIDSSAYFIFSPIIYFDESLYNIYDGNYWNEPKYLIYTIKGEWQVTDYTTAPGFRYDYNPASEPYIIPTGFNQKPSKPSTPNGPESGKKDIDYTYTSISEDSDGHYLYYLFDWGDGSDSGWVGPYNSGEVCKASYNWAEKGDYDIKVKTKDIYDCESEFSDILTVDISKGKSKNVNSFLLRFLEKYPILYKLFEGLLSV